MSSIPIELAEILNAIQRPGKFFSAGLAEIYMPSLEVEGAGLIALPLLPVQAEQLVAVAERAPYGRGAETLVDTEAPRTWRVARRIACWPVPRPTASTPFWRPRY